jgi:hypothetical protein
VRRLLLEVRLLSYSPTPLLPCFATHLHQLSGDSTAAADTPLSVRRLLLEVRLLSYSPTPLLPYSASAVTLSQQLMLRAPPAAGGAATLLLSYSPTPLLRFRRHVVAAADVERRESGQVAHHCSQPRSPPPVASPVGVALSASDCPFQTGAVSNLHGLSPLPTPAPAPRPLSPPALTPLSLSLQLRRSSLAVLVNTTDAASLRALHDHAAHRPLRVLFDWLKQVIPALAISLYLSNRSSRRWGSRSGSGATFCNRAAHQEAAEGTQHLRLALPCLAGGRGDTPSREPQRWGTTSCREAAPLFSILFPAPSGDPTPGRSGERRRAAARGAGAGRALRLGSPTHAARRPQGDGTYLDV